MVQEPVTCQMSVQSDTRSNEHTVYSYCSRLSSHVQEAGIDAERLASYDRAIRSEPRFTAEQAPELLRDLSAYLVTLKAWPDSPLLLAGTYIVVDAASLQG